MRLPTILGRFFVKVEICIFNGNFFMRQMSDDCKQICRCLKQFDSSPATCVSRFVQVFQIEKVATEPVVPISLNMKTRPTSSSFLILSRLDSPLMISSKKRLKLRVSMSKSSGWNWKSRQMNPVEQVVSDVWRSLKICHVLLFHKSRRGLAMKLGERLNFEHQSLWESKEVPQKNNANLKHR